MHTTTITSDTATNLVSATDLVTTSAAHLVSATARRAFTTIVTLPGHLLPGWDEEWRDLLPDWFVYGELESPYDVGEFFRGAFRDPNTPRVAFIRNTSLSLGSGYECGAENRDTAIAIRREMRRSDPDREAETQCIKTLRAKNKQKTQAEAASADAGEGDEAEQGPKTYPMGVSERTIRRDAMLRGPHNRTISRYGQCCPRCGRVVRDGKLIPMNREKLYAKGVGEKATCENCGESLNQFSRRWDNTSDRALDLWTSPEYTAHAYDEDGRRVIPWGVRPTSNPRYPLGKLIGKRYAGLLDLFICDEAHKTKAADSAIGQAMGYMCRAAHKVLCLTGTLFGGKASDVYSLLLRTGNVPVLRQWGWNNDARFREEVGIVEEITRTTVSEGTAGAGSAKATTSTRIEERPGITAGLATILQNAGASILLKNMGFHLVNYTEDLVTLEMPKELAWHYSKLESEGKRIIPFEGSDALGSYLQSTLLYPYAPWKPKTIYSRRKDEGFTPIAFTPDTILPHHEWLASYCAEQIKLGRRVLIYAQHTGTDNILPDVAGKIKRLAEEEEGVTLKTACLYSTTCDTDERRAWFAAREADGTNVVLCNPQLVETGLNLIGWPSIVVLEPIYSLFTLAQAKRRAFRPTQTQDCEVTFLCYANTMSEQAISIVARKSAAAAILSGDDLNGGLLEFDGGMDLFKELAKYVLKGDSADAMNADIRAMLQAGAKALKADLESGTRDLLGVVPATITLPAVTLDIPHPVAVEAVPAKVKVQFGDLSVVGKRKVKATRTNLATITATNGAPQQLDLFGLLMSASSGTTQQAML